MSARSKSQINWPPYSYPRSYPPVSVISNVSATLSGHSRLIDYQVQGFSYSLKRPASPVGREVDRRLHAEVSPASR